MRDQHVEAEDPADLPQGEDLRTPQPLFTQLFTDIGRSESYIGGTDDAAPGQAHSELSHTALRSDQRLLDIRVHTMLSVQQPSLRYKLLALFSCPSDSATVTAV